MRYGSENIIINKYPKMEQLCNGKWKQVWDIELKKSISKNMNIIHISQKLSHEDFDFDVQIQIMNEKQIKIHTKFDRDTNPYHHDHSLITIYKMFEKIELLLGDIETIQGQKTENRWNPWRK